MKFQKLFFSLFLFMMLSGTNGFSQDNIGVGGAALYNLQTKSFGLGVRAEYPIEQIKLLEGVSVSPQFAYYPWFNNIHEFYLGASAHLGLYKYRKWKLYGLANLSFNGWFNYNTSGVDNAKFGNLGFDLGGGITTTKCNRPFFEFRYNFKWNEANVRVGYIYTFRCKQRGMVPCPNIPDPPKINNL